MLLGSDRVRQLEFSLGVRPGCHTGSLGYPVPCVLPCNFIKEISQPRNLRTKQQVYSGNKKMIAMRDIKAMFGASFLLFLWHNSEAYGKGQKTLLTQESLINRIK